MKYVKVIKPGTSKNQFVRPDQVEFYRQFGWEPEAEDTEVRAVLKPRKKTAKAEPAVEGATPSLEEVGTQDDKGD